MKKLIEECLNTIQSVILEIVVGNRGKPLIAVIRDIEIYLN